MRGNGCGAARRDAGGEKACGGWGLAWACHKHAAAEAEATGGGVAAKPTKVGVDVGVDVDLNRACQEDGPAARGHPTKQNT